MEEFEKIRLGDLWPLKVKRSDLLKSADLTLRARGELDEWMDTNAKWYARREIERDRKEQAALRRKEVETFLNSTVIEPEAYIYVTPDGKSVKGERLASLHKIEPETLSKGTLRIELINASEFSRITAAITEKALAENRIALGQAAYDFQKKYSTLAEAMGHNWRSALRPEEFAAQLRAENELLKKQLATHLKKSRDDQEALANGFLSAESGETEVELGTLILRRSK